MEEINEDLLQKELKKFNWAAFLVNWLWGMGNLINHWSIWASLILFILSFLNVPFTGLILLILSVYLGFCGNKLAYYNSDKEYETLQDFINYQRKWVVNAFIILGIFAIAGSIFALIMPSGVYMHAG